jgi:hypothetical protein
MVLLSGGQIPRVGKALWSVGFLPSVYQGVRDIQLYEWGRESHGADKNEALNAGFDHEKLSLSFQGRNQKLTGVKPARVVTEVLV